MHAKRKVEATSLIKARKVVAERAEWLLSHNAEKGFDSTLLGLPLVAPVCPTLVCRQEQKLYRRNNKA